MKSKKQKSLTVNGGVRETSLNIRLTTVTNCNTLTPSGTGEANGGGTTTNMQQ
ncbi:hypothetical protein N7U66_12620 [Lacinutrix neustonica]|uniref:Uncharacterized protein n=1 Tax=Lacinutrix neustonica TaxID=2980107 RepID=A0A9E8MVG9_9FLAO|nr:hypothetical protein [Lacinutrix neustonica]WAC01019.1 hypothetical protein N7U66_12620 [Lacinutrix neustonica]